MQERDSGQSNTQGDWALPSDDEIVVRLGRCEAANGPDSLSYLQVIIDAEEPSCVIIVILVLIPVA
jgi:hypothetical protein